MKSFNMEKRSAPKFLTEETMFELEGFVQKEMEPLDMEEIGESIGVPQEEIDEDLKYLKSTQDKIKRSNEIALAIKQKKAELGSVENTQVSKYYERLGHIFEGFLYTHIGESKIFKDVILHKTSEFDDIKNGVDFVAEYQNPDDPKSYIALAMDASFSMSQSLIDKKMQRSIAEIGANKLSKVKYFQFDEGAEEERVGMPRVVVGTDEDRTRSLLQRWHSEKSMGMEVSFEEDPVWTIMALQIKEQLKMFIEEANYHKQPQLASICAKYLKALEISLRVNSELVDRHVSLMSRDMTSIAIKGFCSKTDIERSASSDLHKESENMRRDDEMYKSVFKK